MRIKATALFACLLLAHSMGAAAEVLRSIDMDSPSSAVAPFEPARVGHGPNISNGRADKPLTTTYDVNTDFHVWKTPDGYHGTSGLALQIGPEHRDPEVNQKSKIEINVVRQDDDEMDARYSRHFILRNGSSNFLGFAMKLDGEKYDTPVRPVLHFQVWQCCSKEIPPLAMRVVPSRDGGRNAPVQFSLVKRTDANTGKARSGINGEALPFADGKDAITMERNRWYRFVFFLQPNPVGEGHVDLWIDDKHVLSSTGPWGYSPGSVAGLRDTYAVKLGIYRAAQPTQQQIYLDNIRWGTTRESVDSEK